MLKTQELLERLDLIEFRTKNKRTIIESNLINIPETHFVRYVLLIK